MPKPSETPATDALRQHLDNVGTNPAQWSQADRATYNQLSNQSAYETATRPMSSDATADGAR